MKVCALLLLGASVFLCGLCDNTEKKEEPFYVDIVVSDAGRDLGTAVTFIQDTLYSVKSLTVEQAFKVVGEPRVLATNISMTVKPVYRAEDLVVDLKIQKDLIEKAPAPANLIGDYIYFWDMSFTMTGLTGSSYQEEIRASAEHALRRRIAGLQELSYQVLAELPFRLLVFSVLPPRSSNSILWNFNRGRLQFTSTVRRVEHLHDYCDNRYCN